MEDKKEKEKLVVCFADYKTDNNIVEYLSKHFEIEIYKQNVDKNKIILKYPDLIIFSGGEDVDPSIYGEVKGKFTHINNKRDDIERETFNYFFNVPKLGICRGAQFLTVMNGGKLIQHVENHNNSSHSIRVKNKVISIKSDHHQMMYPFNLNKDNYELIGFSEYFLSSVYLNGNNQNIELPSQFVEPEIVFYSGTKSLCIQSHPEWEIGSKDSDYLLNLIKEKLLYNNISKINNNYYETDIEFEEENTESEPFLQEIKTPKNYGKIESNYHQFNKDDYYQYLETLNMSNNTTTQTLHTKNIK